MSNIVHIHKEDGQKIGSRHKSVCWCGHVSGVNDSVYMIQGGIDAQSDAPCLDCLIAIRVQLEARIIQVSPHIPSLM